MDELQTSGFHELVMCHLRYYDKRTDKMVESIMPELTRGVWRDFNFDAYLSNYLLPPGNITHQQYVLPDLLPVPPGTKWDPELKSALGGPGCGGGARWGIG